MSCVTCETRFAESEKQGQYYETLFEVLPSPTFVFDAGMRLVDFNRAGFDMMYDSSPEVIGLLAGEVMGCVHACKERNTCGTTPACGECGLRNSARETLETGKTIRAMATLEMMEDGRTVARELLIGTAALDEAGRRLAVMTALVMQPFE